LEVVRIRKGLIFLGGRRERERKRERREE